MNDNHRHILTTLNRAGHDAYVVGGSVRDYCLGRPAKDVDITTSATPEQVAALFPTTEFVGAHFGVTLVKLEGEAIEVATFRTDGAYSDNRHPDSVTLTTDVNEDLKRRDFTLNALIQDASGMVMDPLGQGLEDLRNGYINTVGDPNLRFQEDALRMLRAVRFMCQLGFTSLEPTLLGIYNNAHLIKNVSAERIAGELNKILTSGRAGYGIYQLDNLGLLQHIIPEVEALEGCPQSPKWHPEGNVYQHTLGLLEQLPAGCSLTLALGALLHDIGKPSCLQFKEDGSPNAHGHEEAGEPIAEAILQRLKYPNEVIDAVTNHVRNHMTFSALPEMRKSKQLRFLRQDNFEELLELHRIDRMAATGDLSHYNYARAIKDLAPEEVLHPKPLITGHDLIALGLTPGPEFKEILLDIETLQLEGKLTTREAALRYLEPEG